MSAFSSSARVKGLRSTASSPKSPRRQSLSRSMVASPTKKTSASAISGGEDSHDISQYWVPPLSQQRRTVLGMQSGHLEETKENKLLITHLEETEEVLKIVVDLERKVVLKDSVIRKVEA